MLEPTRTKFYTYEDTDAPLLKGDYLEITNILKKTLIEGFNLRIPLSMILADNVLTIFFQENPGYKDYQVISISGADNNIYNREFRINSVNENSINILVDETFNAPPTNFGEITIKCAPLGFIKKFEEQGQLVFTSPSWAGSVRIEDYRHTDWTTSWAKFARIQIATDHSDVNTAVGTTTASNTWMSTPTTYEGQTYKYWVPYRIYASRSSSSATDQASASATAKRAWYIFGDEKGFYFINNYYNSSPLSKDYFHYHYIGNYIPLAHEAVGFTHNSILLLSSYNNNYTSTSRTDVQINNFCRDYDGTYQGIIFNGYNVKDWFRLKPTLSYGQVYSGTVTQSSVPANSEDSLGVDILTPIFIEQVVSGSSSTTGYALVGLARGVQSIATDISNRDTSDYVIKKREIGSCLTYITCGRNKDMFATDIIKDWD